MEDLEAKAEHDALLNGVGFWGDEFMAGVTAEVGKDLVVFWHDQA